MSNTHATTDSHSTHGATTGNPGAGGHKHEHAVPLWSIFGLLTLFTAAEVGFFEVWSHTDRAGHPFVPKYVMVLTILIVLTLPKAAMVLIYFMHLKFEKHLVILAALIPFAFAALVVLPPLTDIKTLKSDGKTYNNVDSLPHYGAGGHGHEAIPGSSHAPGNSSAATHEPAAKSAGNAEAHSAAPAESTDHAPAKPDADGEATATKSEPAKATPKSEEY